MVFEGIPSFFSRLTCVPPLFFFFVRGCVLRDASLALPVPFFPKVFSAVFSGYLGNNRSPPFFFSFRCRAPPGRFFFPSPENFSEEEFFFFFFSANAQWKLVLFSKFGSPFFFFRGRVLLAPSPSSPRPHHFPSPVDRFTVPLFFPRGWRPRKGRPPCPPPFLCDDNANRDPGTHLRNLLSDPFFPSLIEGVLEAFCSHFEVFSHPLLPPSASSFALGAPPPPGRSVCMSPLSQ